jgi:hypothetical protein
MGYNPRNRNELRRELPKSSGAWFDRRSKDETKPIGFEPERWGQK